MKKPVIIVATANYSNDEHSDDLRTLGAEIDSIRAAFFTAEQQGLCEIIPYFDASVEKIEEAFHQYKGAVIGLHYAGHANGFQLMLEQAADAGNFAAFLGKQSNLKFVFLNGCSTRGQVDELHAEGVPAVIATSEAIRDDIAQQFAEQFYSRLAEGASIEAAFNSYQDVTLIKQTPKKDLYRGFQVPSTLTDRFPWELFIKPGAEEVARWDLPTAANHPLFGLPPIPPLYNLPLQPFRYLQWYGRREAELFFGRGQEIRKLWQNITDPHANALVLFYGQSGVGKSSLLEAGLLPRLEAQYDVRYLRRHPERGLWGTLCEVFITPPGIPESPRLSGTTQRPEAPLLSDQLSGKQLSGSEIRKLWKEQELLSGKTIIIILDQAEEALTRAGHLNELTAFMEAVRELFPDQRPLRPQGKLILSFRKEYLAEIQQHIQKLQIPYVGIGLERLGRQGIIEVVNGLISTERLRTQYNVQIDLGLPEAIAELLSNDPSSAIAPVLQIMMSRLWDDASALNSDLNRLTLTLFQEYRKKGWELSDFLNKQTHEITAALPDAVKSGLLLDLLYFHTTGFSTTQERTWDDIAERYPAAQQPTLKKLLQRLCDTYLLMEVTQNTPEKGVAWALAHDTLGPVIRQQYHQSTTPGQLASRIWNSIHLDHLPDEDQDEWAKNWLNEEQLQLVTTGRNGMRKLSKQEERLILESRDAITARKTFKKRAKIALWSLGILVVGILIAMLLKQRQLTATTRATALRYEAQVMEATDPTKALQLLEESLKLYPTEATRDIWYHIRREHLFYETLFTHEAGRVTAAAFTPGASDYALSVADSATAAVWVHRFQTHQAGQPIATMKVGTEIECLRFSADGNRLLGAGGDRQLHCWDVKGQDWPGAQAAQDIIQFAAMNAQGSQAAFVAQNSLENIHIQQLNDSTFTTIETHSEVAAVVFLPEKGYLAAGFADGGAAVIDPVSRQTNVWVQHHKPVTAMSVSPHGKYLAIAWADTTALICPLTQGIPDLSRSVAIKNMEAPARCLVFSPDEKMLLAGSTRGGLLLSVEEGYPLSDLHTEGFELLDAAFQPNSGAIYTLDTKGRLLKWALPYPVAYAITPAEQAHFVGSNAVLMQSDMLQWVALPFLTPIPSGATAPPSTALCDYTDGQVLLVTSQNELLLYDQETGTADTLALLTDIAPVTRMTLSPDTAMVLIEDQTGLLIWWNWVEHRETGRFTPEKGFGAGTAFSPDGQWLFTLGQDGWCMAYPTGALLPSDSIRAGARTSAYRTQALCVQNAQTIFFALDRHISVWNRATRQIEVFRPTSSPITRLWMPPHQQVLFSGEEHGLIYRWHINDRRPDRVWKVPRPVPVQSIATNEQYLLATYLLPDGVSEVRLWGLE